MKKHLIIVGIICAASIPPAYAVTKCVKLTPSTTCMNRSSSGSNWSITCGDIKIQGVAFCGSQDGGSFGTKSETVTTSLTSDDNKYCWCKMVSPAVSSWVFGGSAPSTDNCVGGCASSCGYDAQINSFSGLSD